MRDCGCDTESLLMWSSAVMGNCVCAQWGSKFPGPAAMGGETSLRLKRVQCWTQSPLTLQPQYLKHVVGFCSTELCVEAVILQRINLILHLTMKFFSTASSNWPLMPPFLWLCLFHHRLLANLLQSPSLVTRLLHFPCPGYYYTALLRILPQKKINSFTFI